MKILLISPHAPPYGGIANWTAIIRDYAEKTDDSFRYINISPKKRSTEGRNIFHRIVCGGIDMLKKKHELKKMIKEYPPDVIHLTSSGSLSVIRDFQFIKIAKKRKIPLVYHLHFGRTEEMLSGKSKLKGLFKKCLCSVDAVITIDKKTFDCIEKYFPEIQKLFIPNPIDLEQISVFSKTAKKQVIFLGWIIPEKGVSELIEAWNTIGAEYPEYNLLCVGPYRTVYIDYLKKKLKVNNVIFSGEKKHEDAIKAINESEIFILPSYTEGFPYSVLEAMSLSKPVIATDVGDIPNMLKENCGIIIEPKNVRDIIISMRRLLNDTQYANEIGSNAYKKVKEKFIIEKVYELYRQIWCKVSQ